MDLSINTSDELETCEKISIVKLIRETWPPKESEGVTLRFRPILEEDLKKKFGSTPEEKHIILKKDGQISGYAKSFLREIKLGEKHIRNMALACVCVKKDLRKNGFGCLIVKKAFEAVDKRKFECSLFQTAVPEFYEKIGAKRILNRCITSQENNENPWWDPSVMIYPANFKLSEDVIDLMGKGY